MRRHRAHYDVIVMVYQKISILLVTMIIPSVLSNMLAIHFGNRPMLNL